MEKANPFQVIKVNSVPNHGNVETVAAFLFIYFLLQMSFTAQ